MVTKKKIAAKPTISAKLKFNPEWFSDPVPPFKNLNPRVIKELAVAKREFAARVNEILAKGQK